MKFFFKLLPIILLLGFISISPKTRNLIGTSFDYLSKFVLSTVNKDNKDSVVDFLETLEEDDDVQNVYSNVNLGSI